jgi:hypothetical protein
LLAALAPLALAAACDDPELKSELVTEGPPEVVEVNVLSEDGEAATFCRQGADYKVSLTYCPEERDSTNKPIAGQRGTDPVLSTAPFGPSMGEADIWYTRLVFDELLDPDVEDLVTEDGITFGSLADTQPVTLRCGGADVAYDGYYDPSGNHLSDPPGPSLFISALEFVATGSECTVELQAEVVDKSGEAVPAAQRGPYEFALSPLSLTDTSVPPTPAGEDPPAGIDPLISFDLFFNAPVDLDTLAGTISFVDEGANPVAFTVEHPPSDPMNPASAPIPFVLSIIPDAPLDEMTTYTVTLPADLAVEDIAGGTFELGEELVITFVTGMLPSK